ncbi:uncharacterized protein MELLADRAFT_123731 [Melampsora larici-populina 98AG31]|uniref:Secreted protein n=1 Tax=Melampsora larici-populina (strain 98AG31 / pathotype 3-4-7) TaxID=747676 RepID=F4R4X8_MELLP|nr:uncharacterized protein MELLADRAFT_123731 [Melampsora larici-populina 98AG31]EGG12918.1 secreted protein [Melampsora larici-populina 98AG31]
MARFSITLLAIVIVVCPFFTGAFNWHADFKFKDSDLAYIQGQPWTEEEIKNSVERFYKSIEDKNIDDAIAQMHPKAKFRIRQDCYEEDGVGIGLHIYMPEAHLTVRTEIEQAGFYMSQEVNQLDKNVIMLYLLGTLKVGRKTEALNVDMVLKKNPEGIKVFRIQVHDFNRKVNPIRPGGQASQ